MVICDVQADGPRNGADRTAPPLFTGCNGERPLAYSQMKTPKGLLPLIEDGIIDGVLHQLQSGKEAAVYVVSTAKGVRCAKVYKQAEKRSFKRAVEYTEGRRARGA